MGEWGCTDVEDLWTYWGTQMYEECMDVWGHMTWDFRHPSDIQTARHTPSYLPTTLAGIYKKFSFP